MTVLHWPAATTVTTRRRVLGFYSPRTNRPPTHTSNAAREDSRNSFATVVASIPAAMVGGLETVCDEPEQAAERDPEHRKISL